ncbi:DNA polymerase V [Rahnella inusitata]|uniref:DNA polymerase V n=1 Tax=Rahnella inusitata TaxID=58169 RepID=UPI0039BDC0A5
MAKYYDVKAAFSRSITLDPKRGRVVTTERFVQELAKLNHFWSLREANEWITHYQGFFRDYSDQEGESKRYFLKNMGYVK